MYNPQFLHHSSFRPKMVDFIKQALEYFVLIEVRLENIHVFYLQALLS